MKKQLLLVLSIVFLFGCSSDSDSKSDCGSVILTGVTQQGDALVFNYQTAQTFNYFEIGYSPSQSIQGSDPSNANTFYLDERFTTTDVGSTTHVNEALRYYAEDNQTLSFFIRAQCTNGDLTEWNGPIVLQIDDFCGTPSNVNVSGGYIGGDYSSYNTSATFFQVEYGPQGFSLGSGTSVNATGYSTDQVAMLQGNTYDFYIRAFCDNGIGFGAWAGPFTAYADQDYNACNLPTNVLHEIEYNFFGDPVGVVFRWDLNGDSSFEHVLVSQGYDPNSTSSVNTSDGTGWPVYSQGLYQNTPYDFYIRTVCLDGSKTSWVGPKTIVIN